MRLRSIGTIQGALDLYDKACRRLPMFAFGDYDAATRSCRCRGFWGDNCTDLCSTAVTGRACNDRVLIAGGDVNQTARHSRPGVHAYRPVRVTSISFGAPSQSLAFDLDFFTMWTYSRPENTIKEHLYVYTDDYVLAAVLFDEGHARLHSNEAIRQNAADLSAVSQFYLEACVKYVSRNGTATMTETAYTFYVQGVKDVDPCALRGYLDFCVD
ncbi:hypothetical protein NP493_133g01037 [Ridgeia piscesae]|uniref:Uncharacterized protein n=1 Tax=Ridgeia piscesae TaxID=27915 RepID=A0AAD9P592_RIDPI|nr:hypothetical protein NP493_133g01037 [Ridgeia piscesae]